ncbi:Uncharacterised protein [Mycobacteroides abscessus subsp. abscessus]|nr:Uncharacterised protein [Mycobacteroides abscessus subsp. abscessus]SKW42273.1 Uncharacterised protein [Mycobacteroides abscessus subsp. abscessus]SLE40763.1 Uncharacterised protein [Mycobacteroides abscessus subsp. massiliense]
MPASSDAAQVAWPPWDAPIAAHFVDAPGISDTAARAASMTLNPSDLGSRYGCGPGTPSPS